MAATAGPKLTTDGLDLYLDARNNLSYPGSGVSWKDLSNNFIDHTLFGTSAAVAIDGVDCIDCSVAGRYVERTTINYTIPTSYTMTSWAWLLPDVQVSTWRTLWRTGNSLHPILIQNDTNAAGMWIGGTFRTFSYDVGTAGLEAKWTMWTIAGESESTMLYINGQSAGPAIAFSAAGGTHRWIGANSTSQPWGYVSTAMIYNRRMSSEDITQVFNATRGRYGI